MLETKTIRIDKQLHSDAVDHVKKSGTSGGFSGYVQTLIKTDLKKNYTRVKEDK